ncbi:MAG TPA: universal stress protein [Ferruginibacter sp.]|nr:universal stress protein [Ferruginibacter sp.]
MKTLLVLTDFSKTAEYAAFYACILAKHLGSETIVLYHSQQLALPVSEAVVLESDEKETNRAALKSLEDLEAKISGEVPQTVKILRRTDMIPLIDINSVATEEKAGLIVMGTANKTKLEEIFLGSNAVTVCKISDHPVVLVPAHLKLQPVKKIVFACDMKEVNKTIPAAALKQVLDNFKVPLTVLNVDNEDKHFTPETPQETMTLHDILKDYTPEYYNIQNENVVSGIIEFAKENPATLVLLISKSHNFMEGLFYRSLTRRLAYVTPFPLLILREKEQ